MYVRALVSFSDVIGSYHKGAIFILPEGVDWLKAGLVEEVIEETPVEAPVKKPRKAKAE